MAARDRRVPTRSRDDEYLRRSTSAFVTFNISAMSCLASSTTRAVMSLVSDAMGITACAFFPYRTAFVFGSRMRTALDFSATILATLAARAWRAWAVWNGTDRHASASKKEARNFISPDRQLGEPGHDRQADLANP